MRVCRLLKLRRLGLALILAALLMSVLCVAGCGGSSSSAEFSWDNVKWDSGQPVYQGKGYECKIGVDVSECQGDINWQEVANSGIDFAFIRVGNRGTTEGKVYPDSYFSYNYRAATKAGIKVGVYFFSQALTEKEAQEEAALTIQMLQAQGFKGEVAFDYEITMGDRISSVSAKTASSCAKAFCEAIEAAGYEPVLYGNPEDLGKFSDTLRSRYPIWYAAYSHSKPVSSYDVEYWQYTNAGSVKGITGDVDMNVRIEKTK